MKPTRLAPLMVAGAMLTTALGASPSTAAEEVDLVLHLHRPGMVAASDVTAVSLTGTTGVPREVTADDFGQTHSFRFADEEPDAYLGFALGNDSVLGDQRRWVGADEGTAEVWLVDGDPRAYQAPIPLDPDEVVSRDGKSYVAVEDLDELEGMTWAYGRNGYVFDGHGVRTIDVLTLARGRDYFEIAVDSNRISYNMTGNMTGAFLNAESFNDVDGFREDDRYYLSFGSVERIFQVRTLTIDGSPFLLEKQDVAHDSLQEVTPETAGFDPDRLAELDTYMQGQVDEGFSGAAVVVTRNGQTVMNSAWGDALKYSTATTDGGTTAAELLPEDERVPVTTQTLFDLASNSKMYAANYAIQRLVSQDRLDIDRTLQSMPGWECFTDENSVYTGKWTKGGSGGIPTDAPVGKSGVTIRNILTHYAGMIPDPEYPNRTSAGELYYQTTDHTDRSGIVEKICQTPLMHTPGTIYAYSDVDYMILGLLVEEITGQPLDEYLQEEFYGPLGLADTMFNPLANGVPADRIAATELNGNTRDGNVSFGELEDGSPVPMRDYTLVGEVHDEKAWYSMAGVAGHAGLFSTTGDMAVLTQLMLNDGIYDGNQYFSGEVIDQFTTPWAPAESGLPASTTGLGWRMHSQNTTGYYYFNWGPSRDTFGHQGWTGTLTVIDPLHDMTITILTNMRHSPVVNPPNGFATGQLDMSSLVPVNAYVYRALSYDSVSSRTKLASLSAEPAQVPAGRTLEITGADFGPDEDVTVTAATQDGEPVELGTVRTDEAGGFSTVVALSPGLPEGEYTITALGATSERVAQAVVTVTRGSVVEGIVAPDATVGTPYELTVQAGDGQATFSAEGLPPGLEIAPETGVISGTPTEPGEFTATVLVAEASGSSAELKVTISVLPRAAQEDTTAPAVKSVPGQKATVGAPVAPVAVEATDASAPLAFAADGLPEGLSINPNTGVISGTPSRAGLTSATVTVTDAVGNRATVRVLYEVNPERTVPYLVPGFHEVNGRQWRTTCEPYSQTDRCTTDIWATQVVKRDGVWTVQNGWAFNNLSYAHAPRSLWHDNPLGGFGKVGHSSTWEESGRQWRTECDTAVTGTGACRTYIRATVVAATRTASGTTFEQRTEWVFNNLVHFTPGS